MPTKILKEIVEFFGKKLDTLSVEIKGAEVVTIKGERGDPGETGALGPQGQTGAPGVAGPAGPQGKEGPQGKVGPRGEKGPVGPKGKDGKDGKSGKDGENGKDVDEKLVKQVTDKLDEVADELRTTRATTSTVLAFSGSTVLTHDLSGSLDGVLKTFTLPSNARVLLVISSSFPNIFRPTVDYTTTASTITFTSEIDAATTLSSGQSIVILYKLP